MDCKIIRDLLPMYIENICSKETELCVREHLAQCENCNNTYKAMISTNDVPLYTDINIEEAQPFKKIKAKQKKRMVILSIVLCILLCICAFGLKSIYQTRHNKLSFTLETRNFYEVLNSLNDEIQRKWNIEDTLILDVSGTTGCVFSPVNEMFFRLLGADKQIEITSCFIDEGILTLNVTYKKNPGIQGYGVSWSQFLAALYDTNTKTEGLQDYLLVLQRNQHNDEEFLLCFYDYAPEKHSILNQPKEEKVIPATSTQ